MNSLYKLSRGPTLNMDLISILGSAMATEDEVHESMIQGEPWNPTLSNATIYLLHFEI
ncbi:hypothetical protein HanRHA438_Chr08g0328181 [Helianthus annuus]|nr:hypothetical protein HanRHA438_Chr08g0328181 [Helianthus annuus]